MRLPRTVRNRLTFAGAVLGALALSAFVFLFVFHTVTRTERAPYAGIVIFVILPAFVLLGLAMVPLDMLLEWRRIKREGPRPMPRLPVVDLNDPRHRNATILFAIRSGAIECRRCAGARGAVRAPRSTSRARAPRNAHAAGG